MDTEPPNDEMNEDCAVFETMERGDLMAGADAVLEGEEEEEGSSCLENIAQFMGCTALFAATVFTSEDVGRGPRRWFLARNDKAPFFTHFIKLLSGSLWSIYWDDKTHRPKLDGTWLKWILGYFLLSITSAISLLLATLTQLEAVALFLWRYCHITSPEWEQNPGACGGGTIIRPWGFAAENKAGELRRYSPAELAKFTVNDKVLEYSDLPTQERGIMGQPCGRLLFVEYIIRQFSALLDLGLENVFYVLLSANQFDYPTAQILATATALAQIYNFLRTASVYAEVTLPPDEVASSAGIGKNIYGAGYLLLTLPYVVCIAAFTGPISLVVLIPLIAPNIIVFFVKSSTLVTTLLHSKTIFVLGIDIFLNVLSPSYKGWVLVIRDVWRIRELPRTRYWTGTIHKEQVTPEVWEDMAHQADVERLVYEKDLNDAEGYGIACMALRLRRGCGLLRNWSVAGSSLQMSPDGPALVLRPGSVNAWGATSYEGVHIAGVEYEIGAGGAIARVPTTSCGKKRNVAVIVH